MKEERIVKLLAMAFMSDNPNVRIGSLDAINRILASDGKDAHWMIERCSAAIVHDYATKQGFGTWSREQDINQGRPQWQHMLGYVFERMKSTPAPYREEEFVGHMEWKFSHHRGWEPTLKQRQWLYDIYKRLKITDF